MEVYFHAVLTWALDGGKWFKSYLCHLPSKVSPSAHWVGGWMSSRTSLICEEKTPFSLSGIKTQFLDYAAHGTVMLSYSIHSNREV